MDLQPRAFRSVRPTTAAVLCCLGLCFASPAEQRLPASRAWQAFVCGRVSGCSPAHPRLSPVPADGPRTARRTTGAQQSSPAVVKAKTTPLWTLKATQMLLFGANVCLIRFITVYYHDLGVSRKMMGLLLVLVPMMAFVGGFFWSFIVDRSGAYRSTLSLTSLLGVATVLSYLSPVVSKSMPLLITVTLLQGFLTAPAGPIVDGLCLKVLAERGDADEAYGDQRLWSAVGWGAMALLAGRLIDIFGTKAIFFSYSALITLNVLIIQLFVQDVPRSDSDKGGQAEVSTGQWLRALCKFEPVWMLTNLLVYGLLVSLIENYLNVFLVQDFEKVPKLLLGAATAVMCLFEIPVFKYIGDLWSKRGYSLVAVLWASEFVMVLRCLLYALLPRSRPWLVLLVEPLHGITFAAVWTATVEYANRLALPGTEAKMQALISGVYFNVAFAAGSLIWGFISQAPLAGLGFRPSFVLDAGLATAWLAIWAGGYAIVSRRGRRKRRPSTNS